MTDNNYSLNEKSTAVGDIVAANVSALAEGIKLLESITPAIYTQSQQPLFQSTIGAHFRHFLEHYECLFEQLPVRAICYDQRRRYQRLEIDFEYACEFIQLLRTRVEEIELTAFALDLQFMSDQNREAVPTTLARELLFLESHTMHHYAMIAAMARASGITTDGNFGVAIATRNFHDGQAPSTQHAASSIQPLTTSIDRD